MNAVIFFAAFFAALALLVKAVDSIQDGFHKIKQARSVARVLPRSPRDTGRISNDRLRGVNPGRDVVTGSSPTSRSSAGAGTLPPGSGTPEHYLIDLWEEKDRLGALCNCGIAEHGLVNRADADAWAAIHGLFIEEAKRWEERA